MTGDARTEPQESGIHVAQFLKEPVGATRQRVITLTEVALDEGLVARDVQGDVRLTRIPAGILATGTADAKVELTCMRCLEPFRQELTVEFADEFRPSVDIYTGAELAVTTDEEFFRIDGAHIVDVREMFRQAFLLGLPMAPHCSEQCTGLLAGAEDGESDSDGRLAVLKLLLEPEASEAAVGPARGAARQQ